MHSPEQGISIMVVDDEFSIRETVTDHLRENGYQVEAYSNGEACLSAFDENPADIIITDVRMDKVGGLDVLQRVKELSETTEVMLITAYADKDMAIQALRRGAFDFFEKPVRLDRLVEAIRRTARYQVLLRERNRLAQHLSFISEREAAQWGIEGFVGQSQTIASILSEIKKLQKSRRITVLIQGESGTGKELVARAIHFGGLDAKGPFVPVNCAAIPGDLAESTLFGHVRGAFTGATGSRKGYFELADGGTLFLDEIGDLPLELQPKLLRVAEDGVLMPVGGTRERTVNVRILAATHMDLPACIKTGTFRDDLYYRLAQFTVTVPPLRERPEDIPLLVEHFLDLFTKEMGRDRPKLSAAALTALRNYAFPGNVRELKNIIERAVITDDGSEIGPEALLLASTSETSPDEDRILAYVQQNGSITNAECRELLEIDRHRASYRLSKMSKSKVLVRRGSHRGARYYLS